MTIKYPDIKVEYDHGENVFGIIGRVMKALKRSGVEEAIITTMTDEVRKSDSYEDAIEVMKQWVDLVE